MTYPKKFPGFEHFMISTWVPIGEAWNELPASGALRSLNGEETGYFPQAGNITLGSSMGIDVNIFLIVNISYVNIIRKIYVVKPQSLDPKASAMTYHFFYGWYN